ncbi:hypothetical protein Bpla01_56710 [Burkholderia plantarii]|nr:hypothetical protein Bpla01_56710 [Burkholderia plantarii]
MRCRDRGGWREWVARIFPDSAEAGGGLLVAIVQLAIASGATVGGLLFDSHSYRETFLASAVLPLIAAALIWLTSRSDTAGTG